MLLELQERLTIVDRDVRDHRRRRNSWPRGSRGVGAVGAWDGGGRGATVHRCRTAGQYNVP